MSHKSNAANTGLLAYGITSNPDPLQASPVSGNPSISSLVITVSNNTMNAIYCNKLTFSFPVGTLAQDFTNVSTGILVSSNPSAKWQISGTAAGVFIATPVTPADNLITTDGLSFQIYNIEANDQVGTFNFYVEENSSTDNKTFTNKTNQYGLGKFPYGFYVNNFAASAPMVSDGTPVVLTWSGSDLATYTMLYGTSSVDVTNVRSWPSPPLTNTTTFALKATVTENGETVDTYLYVTVIVANPELVATSLNVLQGSTLTGATAIGSTLNVAGNTNVSNLTANGSLAVVGNTNVDNIAVSGTLGVSGSTIVNAITANTNAALNSTQINGPLTVNNTVSMLKGGTLIASGGGFPATPVYAKTDGFVVAYIEYPTDISKMSNVVSQVFSSGVWFQDLGGSTGTFGAAWIDTMVANPSTMCVPVTAGTYFCYAGYQMSGNQLPSNIYYYWFSLGKVPAGESAFEFVKNDDPSVPPVPPAPQVVLPDMHEIIKKREAKADSFITKLEEVLDKPMNEKLKKSLAALLAEI